MTREEAISILKSFKITGDRSHEAFDLAIKALEQEPCEDAISRQATKRALEDRFMELQKRHNDKRYETNYCLNTILELPSVTPQQKVGMWIEHFDEIGKWYECDQCHTDWGGSVNYCPNCGAKMEVEE